MMLGEVTGSLLAVTVETLRRRPALANSAFDLTAAVAARQSSITLRLHVA
jgi:hypothetical protein